MAKQTFTSGQVLTAAQMNSLQANDYNWSTNAQTASYVLVAADAGKTVTMTNAGSTTITVNTSLFTAGDRVAVINLGAGATTITAGTATVNSAGSLVLPQYASGSLWFSSPSAAIFIPDEKIVSQIAIFNEQQASGTNGGTFTSGAYNKRTLNTTVINNITGCSLASSVVTLPAGTFNVLAWGQGQQVGNHRVRLQNTTAGTTIALGHNSFTNNGAGYASTTSLVQVTFTLSVSSTIELQHRCQTTKATDGYGFACGFGDNEVYAQIQIARTA